MGGLSLNWRDASPFTQETRLAHQIRLAGPWEHSTGSNDDSVRCQLPFSLPDDQTAATLQRRFHRPSNLSAQTQLSLLIVASARIESVTLNDHTLAANPDAVAHVHVESHRAVQNCVPCTQAVNAFNELRIVLNTECREIFSAHLLIEEPA